MPTLLRFLLFVTLTVCLSAGFTSAHQSNPENRIADPGFERATGAETDGWKPYEQGFTIDREVRRSGAQSIRCVNATDKERRGASWTVELNRKTPAPVLVTGWSKAQNVVGAAGGDYSVYVDVVYADGTPLWGQTAPFSTGTHDWQRKQVLIVPAKPIRTVTIYALFRERAGTVWFDDFSAVVLSGNGFFDSQPVSAPKLSPGVKSGWFARDVAAGSPLLPFAGKPGAKGTAESLGLRLETATGSRGVTDTRIVADKTGKARAVTVYYVERFEAQNPLWWNDIRSRVPAGATGEKAYLNRAGNVGATGLLSQYPFGCVTGAGKGRMLGMPPLLGPRIVRIGYHAGAKLFYAAFDVALTGENRANSDGKGNGRATVAVVRADVSPAWGFRAAAASYYRLFPEAFDRRATAEGIWIPFTDPAKVENAADFGIAYHEGDNSVESDDRLDILSFRYTEPMTWWMPMPLETPRTYEAALEMVKRHTSGADEDKRRWAQAVLHSGSHDEQGRYNVEFRNEPWANGAVWALNPNPNLPHPPGEWTKARLNYDKTETDRRYGPDAKGTLDGEYLDSIEGWADVLDFRPEAIRHAQTPPTFTTDTYHPVVPTWFSVYELTAHMRSDLRRRGKLLMANSTPWRFHAFMPLVDVSGTETDWLPRTGEWRPDTDAVFNLRRTLSYHKPYLLLQNTDFEKFGPAQVEKYFQRSMFYGVYPSMFSIDAATNPYWQQPRWYNRDRHLFKLYIPAIRALSAAGWEPVTLARSDSPRVYIERFGTDYLTVMNDSAAPARATFTIDLKSRGWRDMTANTKLRITDIVTGERIANVPVSSPKVTLTLAPEQARALQLIRSQ